MGARTSVEAETSDAAVSATSGGSEPGASAAPPDDGSPSRVGLAPCPDPDAQILAAIRGGQLKEALALCARHHALAVGRLCMALTGTQAEAEDLTQETLLLAYDGLAGFRGDGSVRGWLFAIARRRCARHLERRQRRETRLRAVDDEPAELPADAVEARRRAEIARGALEAIRPSEREALLLRYIGELSFREVALACGIEEAAARKRVSRAISKLRARIGTEG